MKTTKLLSLTVILVALIAFGTTTSTVQASNAELPITPMACGGNFKSTFTSNKNCWVVMKGKWTVNNGKLQTPGVKGGKWASIAHKTKYSTFTYSIKMKRKGNCTGCANTMLFRGTPKPFGPDGIWKKSYMFQYTNSGMFSIYTSKGSTLTPLIGWASVGAIKKGGWNILKVTAKGNNLNFYINNTKVAGGTDSTFSTGKVGISMYRSPKTKGKLLVDFAKLVTSVASLDFPDGAFTSATSFSGGSISVGP